jgi:eukaryotic-like serine/threonine-protein kinase
VTTRPPLGTGSPTTDLAIWMLIVSVFAGSAVLARYNLRRGEGDRVGARRLATCAVFLGVTSIILRPHHVPIAVEEITYLFAGTGWVLAWGGLTWLVYISLEPFLRRRWPRTLISWNRLLAGRVRDPLVGRDVLIGMLAGVIRLLLVLVPISARGASAYSPTTLESLQSVPRFLNVVLPFQFANSLVGGLAAAFVLVVITLIVRKTWIAVSLAILIAIPLSRVAFGWPVIFVLAAPLLTYTVFLRVGLVAFIATYFVDVLFRVPVTLDPSAWYFGNSLVVLLGLAALAIGAFLISLGGRPAFGSSSA